MPVAFAFASVMQGEFKVALKIDFGHLISP